MIKTNVVNELTGKEWRREHPTKAEAQAWVDRCISKNYWGKPGEYTVTETDLSQDIDFRNEQKIEARKKEYPSIEEMLHVIFDNGLDSPEMAALQAERAAIKLKHKLES